MPRRRRPVVARSWGRASYDALAALGFAALEWREYPMPHSACDEEVRDAAACARALGRRERPPRGPRGNGRRRAARRARRQAGARAQYYAAPAAAIHPPFGGVRAQPSPGTRSA